MSIDMRFQVDILTLSNSYKHFQSYYIDILILMSDTSYTWNRNRNKNWQWCKFKKEIS